MLASRLQLTESVASQTNRVLSRLRLVMEEVDMALYDKNFGIGYVYGNLGDLIKRVSPMGSQAQRPGFFRALALENRTSTKDTLAELKQNVGKLDELHKRLNYMMIELEGLVKKG